MLLTPLLLPLPMIPQSSVGETRFVFLDVCACASVVCVYVCVHACMHVHYVHGCVYVCVHAHRYIYRYPYRQEEGVTIPRAGVAGSSDVCHDHSELV